jgi:hypothetical protein
MSCHLGENAPILQAPVDCLVVRPDAALHLEVLGGIHVVLGALDLVRMLAVAIVSLNALARLKKVCQVRGEDLDVRPRTGGVRALDPHQVPHQDIHPQLVAEGGGRRADFL